LLLLLLLRRHYMLQLLRLSFMSEAYCWRQQAPAAAEGW
jgi:hypothetical protein